MKCSASKRSARLIFNSSIISIATCAVLTGCNAARSDLSILAVKEPTSTEKVETGIHARQDMVLDARYKEILLADRIMQVAEPLLGTRYRYGGTTPQGFDCSGFTRAVFAELSMDLPRSSSEQAEIGHPVERSQLKPGDLVFFDIRRRGRISHVGIYIGNNEIVHASRHSGVVVDKLSDEYYDTRYESARRVIDHEQLNRILAGMHETASLPGNQIR